MISSVEVNPDPSILRLKPQIIAEVRSMIESGLFAITHRQNQSLDTRQFRSSRLHMSRRGEDRTEASVAFRTRVELIDGIDRVVHAIHRLARTPGRQLDLRGNDSAQNPPQSLIFGGF